MKYLKAYKVFESDNSKLIEELEKLGISNYTINEDGTIDVFDNVYLQGSNLGKIPFTFGKVTGNFNCRGCKLTSLEGCPQEVGGHFRCYSNNLIDLIGGPQEVGGDYDCTHNLLKTLEGLAGDIKGSLICTDNDLTSLDTSSVIEGNIYCKHNNFKEEPEFFGICGGEIKFR